MTKKVYEVGAHSKDEEATLDGREDKSTRYPMEPVPIKAWTEGPCKSMMGFTTRSILIELHPQTVTKSTLVKISTRSC